MAGGSLPYVTKRLGLRAPMIVAIKRSMWGGTFHVEYRQRGTTERVEVISSLTFGINAPPWSYGWARDSRVRYLCEWADRGANGFHQAEIVVTPA